MNLKSRLTSRHTYLAPILSLLLVGLGQYYNRQYKKAVVFFIATFSVQLLMIAAVELEHVGLFLLQMYGIDPLLRLVAFADALFSSGGEREADTYQRFRYYALLIAAMVVLSLGTIQLAYVLYGIKLHSTPTPSMEPTILQGESVAVKRIGEIREGDPVVFVFPGTDARYIKRCARKLPEGCFMLNDNQAYPHDSREYGPIPYDNIIARPLFVYFSEDFDRILRGP